jgi:hypothetical protein
MPRARKLPTKLPTLSPPAVTVTTPLAAMSAKPEAP